MKIRSVEFIKSAVSSEHYPSEVYPEIALVGRSNVGKSSLINTLVARKKLAKTSSTPGKTRTINFYKLECVVGDGRLRSFYLVDLPGYGYAKVPRSERRSWREFIGDYFENSKGLAAMAVLLDARRDPTETERKIYDWAADMEVPVVTVFTKSDKLSNNKMASRRASIKKNLNLGEVVLFSALNGKGKAELLKVMEELLDI
jgi:GTP-binding protein